MSLAIYKQSVQQQLKGIADALADAPTELMPEAEQLLRAIDEWAEEQRKRVKEHLQLFMSVNGKQVTEKGTLGAILGDYNVRAVPLSTLPDTDKLKALLVAKGVSDPNSYFEKKVTYKATRTTLDILVARKVLTQEEADSVVPKTNYRFEVRMRQEDSNASAD